MTGPTDWNDKAGAALAVACGLELCGAQPGEPCINTADNIGPRESPHANRVARARRPEADPSVTDWRKATGLSTSAQLRKALAENEALKVWNKVQAAELAKTQAALAASQSDLTAALYEREKAIDALIRVRAQRERLKDNERRWAGEVEYAERERDLARAELASAVKELEMLRAKADAAYERGLEDGGA